MEAIIFSCKIFVLRARWRCGLQSASCLESPILCIIAGKCEAAFHKKHAYFSCHAMAFMKQGFCGNKVWHALRRPDQLVAVIV